jgi:hypothetical protein
MSSLALTMQIDIRYVFLIEIAKLYDHRMHISVIGKGMNLEKVTLKKSVEALKSESHEKYREDPLFSSLKKQLDVIVLLKMKGLTMLQTAILSCHHKMLKVLTKLVAVLSHMNLKRRVVKCVGTLLLVAAQAII